MHKNMIICCYANEKHEYLLNDLFVCGHCNGIFRGWKSNTSKQNPYYSCTTNRNLNRKGYVKGRKDCDIKRNLNMINTDELVWESVRNVITKSNLFKESIKKELLDDSSLIQTKTDIKKIESKLKKNDHLIQRISESIVNQETDKSPIDINAEPYFNKLLKCGIFHNTPESAAKHISLIWNNVYDWWENKNVQEARINFCDQYSHNEKNPSKFIYDLISQKMIVDDEPK